jgi:ribonuclease HI
LWIRNKYKGITAGCMGNLNSGFSAMHISELQVFRDSKIVINWLNNKGNLNVISLDCWKERIRDLRKSFSLITFSHIYRESNKEADRLSKQALQKQEGKIAYNHWEDGNEGPTLYLSLF